MNFNFLNFKLSFLFFWLVLECFFKNVSVPPRFIRLQVLLIVFTVFCNLHYTYNYTLCIYIRPVNIIIHLDITAIVLASFSFCPFLICIFCLYLFLDQYYHHYLVPTYLTLFLKNSNLFVWAQFYIIIVTYFLYFLFSFISFFLHSELLCSFIAILASSVESFNFYSYGCI